MKLNKKEKIKEEDNINNFWQLNKNNQLKEKKRMFRNKNDSFKIMLSYLNKQDGRKLQQMSH